MTKNEKKIITLLSKSDPLTKKEITKKCNIGWATAVKMVTRLEKSGIIERAGTVKKLTYSGKNAYVYRLVDDYPQAIGIDVEYRKTTIILHNLRGKVLYSEHRATPIKPGIEDLKSFLLQCIIDFCTHVKVNKENIIGIGIGMPLWILKGRTKDSAEIKTFLERHVNLTVSIENNIHNNAIYEKLMGQAFRYPNSVIITIRNGIGASIFINGELYTGAQGIAGEIGHIKVEKDGILCHCGKRGCLETLVNQYTLYSDYIQQVLGKVVDPRELEDENEISVVLSQMFRKAKQGDAASLKILKNAARYLSKGIVSLLLILNIPKVFIVGKFGKDGDVILTLIKREVAPKVLSHTKFDLHYVPLDEMSFAKGASLLILKDFYYHNKIAI